MSQESSRRPWINFEAAIGVGRRVPIVPLTLSRFTSSQVPFPIAGVQIYSIDDIHIVLRDVGAALDRKPANLDIDAYLAEMREVEAHLNYRSLRVTPVFEGNQVSFEIENIGNIDIELLMLEASVPASAVATN